MTSIVLLVSGMACIGRLVLKDIPTIAAFSNSKPEIISADVKQEAQLFLATYILDIFQVACQTFLLGYLVYDRFELRINGHQKQVFMFLLQFLAMSNLMAWVYSSFIYTYISFTNPWNFKFFDPLVFAVLDQFTLPFSLFFRFFSMHIILEVYHKLKSEGRITADPHDLRLHIGNGPIYGDS